MTKQEALNVINKYFGCSVSHCGSHDCDGCDYYYDTKELKGAMERAIECIDKHIPKKHIEKFDNNRRLYCSNCRAYHGIYGDLVIPTSSKYCCWCGQAIDWSDEDV